MSKDRQIANLHLTSVYLVAYAVNKMMLAANEQGDRKYDHVQMLQSAELSGMENGDEIQADVAIFMASIIPAEYKDMAEYLRRHELAGHQVAEMFAACLVNVQKRICGDLVEKCVPSFNQWFCALEGPRQAVLRDDKWALAQNAYDAGVAQDRKSVV